jgi:hypothetical protein
MNNIMKQEPREKEVSVLFKEVVDVAFLSTFTNHN